MLNWNTFRTMPIDELKKELREQYSMTPLDTISSTDDLKEAQDILMKSTANYSFLSAMVAEIKIDKRRAKREKASKEVIDDLMDREDMLCCYADICKGVYNSTSRQISVLQMIYEERSQVGRII